MKKNFKTVLLISLFLLQFLPLCFGASNAQDESKKEYLNLAFWQKFDDEILINNIVKGYENNLDLKIASLKVKESEKIVKLSLSQELPSISFDGMIGRTIASSDLLRGDNNFMIHSYKQTRFLLPLTLSYEIDLWGKNRLKTKSKNQSLKMLEEDERAAYIILTSSIAADYFNLIKIDKLIELNSNLYELNTKLLDLIVSKEKSGLATKNDILDAKERLAQNQAVINDLTMKKEILENQLGYLLGDKFFSKIERNNFDNIKIIDSYPNTLNSSIILNRPDVKSAKENIIKANYEAMIAKKELLPSFTILGTLGFNGYNNFNRIFGSHTGLADIWINPNLDIFDGGKKYHFMKLKKLEYERVQKEYEKAVLASIQEVNDSLAYLKNEDKNYKLSKNILDIQKEKTDLKSKSKECGLSSEIDYILYRTREILAQEKYVSDKINYIISSINLYKSIGGVDFNETL